MAVPESRLWYQRATPLLPRIIFNWERETRHSSTVPRATGPRGRGPEQQGLEQRALDEYGPENGV